MNNIITLLEQLRKRSRRMLDFLEAVRFLCSDFVLRACTGIPPPLFCTTSSCNSTRREGSGTKICVRMSQCQFRATCVLDRLLRKSTQLHRTEGICRTAQPGALVVPSVTSIMGVRILMVVIDSTGCNATRASLLKSTRSD